MNTNAVNIYIHLKSPKNVKLLISTLRVHSLLPQSASCLKLIIYLIARRLYIWFREDLFTLCVGLIESVCFLIELNVRAER